MRRFLTSWWTAAGTSLRRLGARMAQPLFLIALAAVAGILVADAMVDRGWLPWAVIAAAALAAVWRWRSRALLLAAAAAVFGFAHLAVDADPLRARTAAELAPGMAAPAVFTGMVDDAPDPDGFGGWVFPLALESLRVPGRGMWPAAGTRLRVRLRDVAEPPRYGDRLSCTGLVRRPGPPRNPGEFDLPAWLRRNGYGAEGEISGLQDTLTILSRDGGSPIMASALRAREWIARTVTLDIEDDPSLAATVRAMVLGTREKTPEDVEEAFVASGTMHVFAVSGLHVGMFTVIVWNVLRFFGLRRTLVVALTLPMIFFYVHVTGLRASAWRAALMATVFLTGPLWNREGNLYNSLGAAALLLLGVEPSYLFQPGFTLSFGVLLAMAVFHQPILAALRPLHEPDPFLPKELHTPRQEVWFWFRRKLAESLSLSMASTLGSAPLMIFYFRLITPVGIVANLFLVTLSLCILVVACVAMIAALCQLPLLAAVFNHCNWLLAAASIGSAKFFAAVPGGHVRVDPARAFRGEVCTITVLALDRGGGAIHIDTPGGRHWLVDCGGRRHFGRTVRPHLARAPVNRLDGLVLTHADGDHAGAAPQVSEMFAPRRILGGTGGEPLAAGMVVPLDEGVNLRVLHPPATLPTGVADDACAVLQLECFGTRLLLAGDAGFLTEKQLLAAAADLRADVLVKGWHAGDFSGLPEFLNACAPRLAVFHDSWFPAAEKAPPGWGERLAVRGIVPFDQARAGGVIISVRRAGMEVTGFADDSRVALPVSPAAP